MTPTAPSFKLGSHYVGSLPIVLLFGVATSFDIVHQLLPRPVHAAIATRRFTLQVTLRRIPRGTAWILLCVLV